MNELKVLNEQEVLDSLRCMERQRNHCLWRMMSQIGSNTVT